MKLHSRDIQSIIQTKHTRNKYYQPKISHNPSSSAIYSTSKSEQKRIRAIVNTRTRAQSRSLIALGFDSVDISNTVTTDVMSKHSIAMCENISLDNKLLESNASVVNGAYVNMFNLYFDEGLKKMKNVLQSKRSNLETLRGKLRTKYNKFVTNVDENHSSNDGIHFFGYKYWYWSTSTSNDHLFDSKWYANKTLFIVFLNF